MPASASSPLSTALGVAELFLRQMANLLLAPGSPLSLASLASALFIGSAVLFLRRSRRGRPLPIRLLMRAMFPKRLLWGPSIKADIGLCLFNLFVFGGLFGWAVLTYDHVRHWTEAGLSSALGAPPHLAPAGIVTAGVATLALFLACELGYWVDHASNHRIPFLWAFHKVHHSAEALTPLTNFRVHPVDGVKFANILALFMGVTGGVLGWLFADGAHQAAPFGRNLIILAFLFTTQHLQHSQLWIAFPGVWGRLFVSPAHHQIHHSSNPAHFDRNFGCFLAVWDWAFGTLYLPRMKREPIRFGGSELENPHSVSSTLLEPVVDGIRRLRGPAATAEAPARG